MQTVAEMFRVLSYAHAHYKPVQFFLYDDSPCRKDDDAPEFPTGIPYPYRRDLSTWTMDDLEWDYLLAPLDERNPSVGILESVHPLGWSVPSNYVAPRLPECYAGQSPAATVAPSLEQPIHVTRTVTICADAGESIALHAADGIALVTDCDGGSVAISLDLLRAAARELANI